MVVTKRVRVVARGEMGSMRLRVGASEAWLEAWGTRQQVGTS